MHLNWKTKLEESNKIITKLQNTMVELNLSIEILENEAADLIKHNELIEKQNFILKTTISFLCCFILTICVALYLSI